MTLARHISIFLRGFAALLMACAPGLAWAQTGLTAGMVSDYRYRGVSLSEDSAVPQATINHDWAGGAFAGLFVSGSSLRYTDVNAVGIAYAGFARRITQEISWEAGATATGYRGTSKYNYREVFAGVNANRIGARLYYSPGYIGTAWRTVYADLNASYPINAWLDLTVHAGYLHPIATVKLPARGDMRIGASATFERWNLQLGSVVTRRDARLYPGAQEDRGRRIVAGVSTTY